MFLDDLNALATSIFLRKWRAIIPDIKRRLLILWKIQSYRHGDFGKIKYLLNSETIIICIGVESNPMFCACSTMYSYYQTGVTEKVTTIKWLSRWLYLTRFKKDEKFLRAVNSYGKASTRFLVQFSPSITVKYNPSDDILSFSYTIDRLNFSTELNSAMYMAKDIFRKKLHVYYMRVLLSILRYVVKWTIFLETYCKVAVINLN